MQIKQNISFYETEMVIRRNLLKKVNSQKNAPESDEPNFKVEMQSLQKKLDEFLYKSRIHKMMQNAWDIALRQRVGTQIVYFIPLS